MRLYTESSEWVEMEGGQATVGLCAKTKERIGDIVFLSLPKVGQHVARGEQIAVLESTKAAIDIYTPLSGVVMAVGSSDVRLINEDPEHAGWLYTIQVRAPKEIDDLLTEPPCN